MSIVKKYFFVFASILLSVKSFGQAPTPFSTFGIGEPYGNASVNTQGMGGVGVSQPQFWFINNQNPALLVYNGLTSFQAGLITERRTISSQTLSEKVSGGNMNYLITAFPILPARRVGEVMRWTTSVGLMPLTSVKYKLSYQDEIDGSTELINVTEEGNGGLTTLFWSNGVRINSDFSVGARINYIFSSVVTTYKNQLPATASPVPYFVTIEEQTYVRDWAFTLAGAFSKDSIGSKNYRVSIGATGTLGSDLNARRTVQFYRANSLNQNMEGDTLDELSGTLHLPATVTIGASLSRGLRWSVGGEFTYQDWSRFKSFDSEDEGLEKSWRVALGGEWTPDPVAAENLLKRMTYRLGFNYEKTPYRAPFPDPEQLSAVTPFPVYDYGATFGLSVPAGRSSMDLAFKYGKRGDKAQNLLEETYFRISFGITFNDTWFIKNKYD
jgi:hypothetical protein